MSSPSVWTAILADPVTPFDPPTLRKVVHDQQRWTRRYLYPVLRILSRVLVFAIVALKRVLPFSGRISAHGTMDRLCIWFLRTFVSPEAGELLVRHFIIETNLLNFVIVNAGVADVVAPVTLQPTSLRDLGNRAVIEHDVNVYKVLISLGVLKPVRAQPVLDMSMLDVPAISVEGRRLLSLDIQSALCLMNIPFALCLTPSEYQRAVHSLRLDETLMAVLAELTGDFRFLRWRPAGSPVRVDSTLDVPRAVYEHAVYCEHAHAHLLALAARATPTAGGSPGRRGAPRPPFAPSATVPSSPSSSPATA
jgi:hypothetical protein